ncbi:P-loop containing nucleoside triphosphate hydrolase protein [Coniochaeta sp. 2T2.1]|nr:P-loop containing nucleoside triphosphate hydrolase protein [Coniochaeta sp. 2T2.1]
MLSRAAEFACPLCRFTIGARQIRSQQLPPAQQQPWSSQRLYATRQERRQPPSRMVLSDRVDRPPSQRPGGGDPSKRPRRRVDGPFTGMNRTVANLDTRRPPPQSRDRDKKGRSNKDDKNFKALKMQRALTTIGYGQRSNIKARMQEVESFDQFDLLPVVKKGIEEEVLKGMVDIKPTPIQRLAIPALLGQDVGASKTRNKKDETGGRQEFLLAAETGSGKTLAYMVPAINALKASELEDIDLKAYNERLAVEKERRDNQPLDKWIEQFEPHPNTARPRVVVLVPTAELVDQVTAVAKSLAHVVRLKVRPLSAGYDVMKIQRNLYGPYGVDMIVSTPHLLATIADSDPNILSRVSHLVIDEADSLLDRSFSEDTTRIVDRTMPSLKQLILCSATIPRRLDTHLDTQFPDMRRITTPNLHAIPRRVQLGVIDVSKDPYRHNKLIACADAIWTIGKGSSARDQVQDEGEHDITRIMVFVNERETTQQVADYLKTKGVNAIALHRDTPEQRQSEMLASFTESQPKKAASGAVEKPVPGKRSLPNVQVIVATDLASRGIDTLAVRHVVLYDVPHTTIDFIHRLGRAGRMGRRGRGIVLVGKDDRKDVVAEVKRSMFMGQALV